MTQARPLSARDRITPAVAEARKSAQELPHEWLFRLARGEAIQQKRLRTTFDPATGVELSREWVTEKYYATIDQRIDCAKAAAPYYAPRLATTNLQSPATDTDALRELFAGLAARLPV